MGFEVEKKRRNQELWDQPQAAPTKNFPKQTKKTNIASAAILLTTVLIIIALLLSGVLMVSRRRKAESSAPIPLSTRLSLAKDFIPMPDGMEIVKCEVKGLYDLQIEVSGKAETEKRDYMTGSMFAFSMFDEVKSVTFTEKENGKVYKFERIIHTV